MLVLSTARLCSLNLFFFAPRLARKCEIEHWFSSGVDGRADGVRSRDYQIFRDGLIYLAMALRFKGRDCMELHLPY